MALPSELRRVIDRALDSPGITALSMVLLLVVPVMASSGASRIEPRAASPGGADAQVAASSYEMRCWQQGRLVFEQNLAELPSSDGAQHALRVSGTDRDGRPVYVAETTNATCLVRSVADLGARLH